MFGEMHGLGRRWFRGPHGFGGAGHFGMWMRHGKRRFRRGMLKHVLLRLIEEEPRHGYDLMKFFAERGWGQLAAGTLYPILEKLEEAGFVQSREEDGKRVYTITDAGREKLRSVVDELGDDFEEEDDEHAAAREVHMLFGQLGAAISQLGRQTKPETLEAIGDVLKKARKEIYTILANE